MVWRAGCPSKMTERRSLDTRGFMPLAEAAAWAGVSPRTLKRWIALGLPRYQAGRRSKVLIRPSDVEQFLTRQQAAKPDLNAMVDEVMKSLIGVDGG